MRALNCYPDVCCLVEPFNPHRREKDWTFAVSDHAGLAAALRSIWERHNGIKHVWQASGFPFPKGSSLNRGLIVDHGMNVLFLTRRNDLRRLVSEKISAETGVWGVFNPDERDRVRSHDYSPIGIPMLRARLEEDGAAIAGFREAIASSGTTCMEIVYEDLFDPGVSRESRVASVDRVYRFIGGRWPIEAALGAGLEDLLDHDQGKLNSEESYRRIPGIENIDRRLGSDATGWLFSGSQDSITSNQR